MNVLVLRHHLEDDPGLIGDALVARGATLHIHHVPDDGPLPAPETYDLGIVLGAKWSVYDQDAVGEWINDELEWLRHADDLGVAVLGICFGAQALSTALGGSVERAPVTEIGCVEINSSVPLISCGPWFQFHGDQCLPPREADVLASNDACVQVFTLRKNVALQFHPEIDRQQLQRWIEAGGDNEMRDLGLNIGSVLQETDDRLDASKVHVESLIEFVLANSGLNSHKPSL